MTRKKTKKIVADETSPSKEAASRNYGKTSGNIPAAARKSLGKKS